MQNLRGHTLSKKSGLLNLRCGRRNLEGALACECPLRSCDCQRLVRPNALPPASGLEGTQQDAVQLHEGQQGSTPDKPVQSREPQATPLILPTLPWRILRATSGWTSFTPPFFADCSKSTCWPPFLTCLPSLIKSLKRPSGTSVSMSTLQVGSGGVTGNRAEAQRAPSNVVDLLSHECGSTGRPRSTGCDPSGGAPVSRHRRWLVQDGPAQEGFASGMVPQCRKLCVCRLPRSLGMAS
mmetsp:Transcript_80859/g.261850  ORF Transcript_80859/g.261850 Transcript_80859/m.261850 type:complete len:238 (-) Transcript_80859:242-955(-)